MIIGVGTDLCVVERFEAMLERRPGLRERLLTPAERAERGSFVGCVAGALSRQEYLDGLTAAGFADASVEFTHEVADGMHGAIVRARKPS